MVCIMFATRNIFHALGCTCYDFRSDANKRNANTCKLCCMSVSRPSLARDSEQQHLRKKCPLAKAGSWLEIIAHSAETLHEGRYDCAGRRAFGTHAPRHKTNNTFSDGLCQGAAKFGRNARSRLEHFISRAQHRLRFAVSLSPSLRRILSKASSTDSASQPWWRNSPMRCERNALLCATPV